MCTAKNETRISFVISASMPKLSLCFVKKPHSCFPEICQGWNSAWKPHMVVDFASQTPHMNKPLPNAAKVAAISGNPKLMQMCFPFKWWIEPWIHAKILNRAHKTATPCAYSLSDWYQFKCKFHSSICNLYSHIWASHAATRTLCVNILHAYAGAVIYIASS